jgi:hypothetical protein
MDLTTTKIVVLAVVGLIIMVALLGEFRPRSRARRAHRTVLVPVRAGTRPGADHVDAV